MIKKNDLDTQAKAIQEFKTKIIQIREDCSECILKIEKAFAEHQNPKISNHILMNIHK